VAFMRAVNNADCTVTVLLRTLLGYHSFSARTRVPQASGEGRGRPPTSCAIPLVLTSERFSSVTTEQPWRQYSDSLGRWVVGH
jgi:hypothetical protein